MGCSWNIFDVRGDALGCLGAKSEIAVPLFWWHKLGSTVDDDVGGAFTGGDGDGRAMHGDEVAGGGLVDGAVGCGEGAGDVVDDFDVVVTGGDGFEGELDFGPVESPVIGWIEEF